jgi:NAD-dependent DNA ligase
MKLGVRLGGVTVIRVTAYNARYVKENKLGPGAIIEVIRSGDVIPKVERVITPAKKAKMPNVPWNWNEAGVEAVITEDGHAEQETKRITSFFINIGVDGIGLGNIVKMYDAGYNTIDKILRMKVADYLKIPGFQQRTAEKFYSNIKDACKDAWLPSVADGSGLFGNNFGTKRLEAIYEAYPDFNYLSTLNPKLLQTKIESIRGFSSTMASQFVQGIKPFMDWVKKQPITFAEQEEVELLSNKLQGQRICMTGFRDADLVLEIEANGGENVTSVNAKTTILLVKDVNTTSSKADAARKLNIKVMEVPQFMRTFKL